MQGFPNSGKEGGIPPSEGGIRYFAVVGGFFLPGGRNLRRSDFDYLNLFQI